MNQSSLTYHITAEFLSALRAEGRTIGINKHLQIQTLLKQLPDDADAETLKLALIPLIAQSPQEQERLYETFDQCVKRVEERQPLLIETDPSITNDNIPKVANFWNVLKAMILLVLLLAIGGGLWWKTHQNIPIIVQNPIDSTQVNPNDTLIIKPNTSQATTSPFIDNKPYPFPNHLEQYAIKPVSPTQAWLSEHWTSLRWVLALVLTALLLAIWRYRAWKQRKLVAQQDPNDKPPYIWNINIEGIEPILMGNSLDRLTQQLRRRAQSETLRMDLERTVNATIEQGGLPVFKYKRETNPTDYLLLIDRQSVRNHRAQLFDTLYELFKAQEIEMARYFFDSDVRVCYSEDYPNGIALADLHQRYYQSRLLIVGTGAQLLSPLSGKAAAWTSVFNQWKDRALFSPKPLKAWGYDERQLATAFTTLPATLQSLGFWVEELDAGADARFDGWQDKIDDAPTASILPDDNDPLPILDLYFEPDMLRWIAACAIYPTLHWDLTLWLGQHIDAGQTDRVSSSHPVSSAPLSTFDNLMQLCRLSWFVKGEMPDATRTALLNWLEQTNAPLLTRLRAAIALELQKNPPPKDSAAWDKFRLNIALNEWLSTTDAEKKKALEAEVSQLLEKGAEPDFTVIKYLQKPRTALDFIVPDAWKKYVYPSGFAALGWLKEWKDLWWLLPVWVLGLVLLFNYHSNDFTTVTVFIGDNNGNIVFTQGSVTMDTKRERRRALITENGTVSFNEVKIGSSVTFSIDFSDQYPVLNSDSIFTISTNSLIYLPIGFRTINRVFGTVLHQDKLLEGVKVYSNSLIDTTDLLGRFDLLVPENQQRAIQKITLFKEGYKTKILNSYSQSNEPLIVLLEAIDEQPNSTTLPLFSKGECVTLAETGGNTTTYALRSRPLTAEELKVNNVKLNNRNETLQSVNIDNQTIIKSLNTGESITYLEQKDNWYKVRTNDGIVGYIVANFSGFPTLRKGCKIQSAPVQSTTTPFSVTTNDTAIKAVNSNQQQSEAQILAPTMIEVKGGTFQMGSNDGEADEKPVHRVTLSDFAIGKYEVTMEQYMRFVNETETHYPEWLDESSNYNIKNGKNDLYKKFSNTLLIWDSPIVGVSWNDAVAYCKWLSKKTSINYRLPTEAEWEYAAKGGNKSKGFKYSGSNTAGDVAWSITNSNSRMHRVGTKKANELGIHDMSGNVWEWCNDIYEENYYKNSPSQNPTGVQVQPSSLRALRGGSWYHYDNDCRSSDRYGFLPSYRYFNSGFRVVRND